MYRKVAVILAILLILMTAINDFGTAHRTSDFKLDSELSSLASSAISSGPLGAGMYSPDSPRIALEVPVETFRQNFNKEVYLAEPFISISRRHGGMDLEKYTIKQINLFHVGPQQSTFKKEFAPNFWLCGLVNPATGCMTGVGIMIVSERHQGVKALVVVEALVALEAAARALDVTADRDAISSAIARSVTDANTSLDKARMVRVGKLEILALLCDHGDMMEISVEATRAN